MSDEHWWHISGGYGLWVLFGESRCLSEGSLSSPLSNLLQVSKPSPICYNFLQHAPELQCSATLTPLQLPSTVTQLFDLFNLHHPLHPTPHLGP